MTNGRTPAPSYWHWPRPRRPTEVAPVEHGVGLHGCMDRCLVAVLLDQELDGAVDVEAEGQFSVSMTSPALSSVATSSLIVLGRNWPCQTEFDGA